MIAAQMLPGSEASEFLCPNVGMIDSQGGNIPFPGWEPLDRWLANLNVNLNLNHLVIVMVIVPFTSVSFLLDDLMKIVEKNKFCKDLTSEVSKTQAQVSARMFLAKYDLTREVTYT